MLISWPPVSNAGHNSANVSGTQELHRKNVALEERVAALEAENALRDAKLTAIENMLGKGSSQLASLKTASVK